MKKNDIILDLVFACNKYLILLTRSNFKTHYCCQYDKNSVAKTSILFFFHFQAFINTAKEIYQKIQDGVFDINNEVLLWGQIRSQKFVFVFCYVNFFFFFLKEMKCLM